MRIRLTLDIERRRPAESEGCREVDMGAMVERQEATYPRIGFTPEPGRVEPGWEGEV